MSKRRSSASEGRKARTAKANAKKGAPVKAKGKQRPEPSPLPRSKPEGTRRRESTSKTSKRRRTNAAPASPPRASRSTSRQASGSRLKPLGRSARLIVQTERTKTPSGKGRADKYRYPKGHPKAGQYAPKSEAAKVGAVRYVKTRAGKRRAIAPESEKRARSVKAAPVGRGFTGKEASYDLAKSIQVTSGSGGAVWIRIGGKVYKVPKSKSNDAAAMLLDMNTRFKATRRKGGSPTPMSIETSYGANGMLIDLDRLEPFDPDLSDMDIESPDELAGYMAQSAQTFLGIDTDPGDIMNGWDESGTTNNDEDE